MAIKVFNYTDDKYIEAEDTRAERIALIGNKGIGFRGEIIQSGTTDTYTVKEGSHAFIGGLSIRFLSDESFDLASSRYIVIETTYTAPDFYSCTILAVNEISSETAGEVPKHVPIYDKTLGIQNDLKKGAGRFGAYTKEEIENWVKSFGLAGNAAPPPNNDLNDIVETGAYIIGVSANAPFDYGSVFHIRRNNDATQLAISSSASAISMHIRKKSGVGAWSAWLPINAEGLTLASNVLNGNTDGSTYPRGVTSFTVAAEGSNWPKALGTVLNIRNSDSRFTQWFFGHAPATPGAWYRHWYSGSGWSPWYEVSTTDRVGSMHRPSVLSASPSVYTKVVFDETWHNAKGWADRTTGRFTVDKTGYYKFSAYATVYMEANKTAQLSLYKNGSLYRHLANSEATNSAYQQLVGFETASANAGDYFELYARQTGQYTNDFKSIRFICEGA